jgi:signal transduction histidine kinase
MTDRDSRDWPRSWGAETLPLTVIQVLRNAVSLITIVQTLSGLGPLSNPERVLSIALAVLLAAGWSFITSRRASNWADIAALVAVVGIGAWLGVLTGNGQVYVAGYAALFVAPFWYRLPRGLIPAAGGVVAVTLSTMFVGHTDITGGISQGVGATFFGIAALFWGRVRTSAERNAELFEELKTSRDAEAQSAVVAERARLARELHDVLAHTLSSLSLQLESTRVLAKSRGVDAAVQERLDQAVALARSGLVEARAAVGTLRDDELPGPERVASLVADFERSSGMPCHFEQVGDAVPLRPEASVALFRAAQEALTNIGKHAQASRVEVRLEWRDGGVCLTVSDDGRPRVSTGAGSGLPGSGSGLRGMRERAELAGGHLDAGPTATGFAVELRLPA